MKLRSLTAQNFRNLVPAEVSLHDTTNIVVGRNGQGKTNLLEALYFLATTKSFRTPRTASLFRFDAPNIFVTGVVTRAGIDRTLSVGLDSVETRRRVLMINGTRVTLSDYVQAMSVFAYSAARLEILRGSPEERRRFLDRGIASLNPAYLEQLTRYTRVLKQRNALLHAIAAGESSPSALEPWDEEFSGAAAVIGEARGAYAEQLAGVLAAIVTRHSYHVNDLRIVYRPSIPDLRNLRRHEIRARMSLAGPQRDTLDFLINGRPASEVLSGGEQKMVVLFLKFAKIELFRQRHDEAPIFLLDDVDAELDLDVLQQLLTNLPASTQLFATSAKERFLHALETGPHRRLSIENGAVTAAHDFA
jgi:DNA replication and repair protein RecF